MSKEIIKVLPEETMILTQHIGDGKSGDTEFELIAALPSYCPIVVIGKKRYQLNFQCFIEACIEKHNEPKVEEKK